MPSRQPIPLYNAYNTKTRGWQEKFKKTPQVRRNGSRVKKSRGLRKSAITILVDRYVGETWDDGTLKYGHVLRSNELISPFAMLLMPAFDVDFNGESNPSVEPERDFVLFNGESIHDLYKANSAFLVGENDTWVLNGFEVPIQKVKFPKQPGTHGERPVPAENVLTIQIDTANEGEEWCTAIDWASLSIRAMSPVILVHGANSDPEFFTRQGFANALDARLIVRNKLWRQGQTDEYDQRIWLPYNDIVDEQGNDLPELGNRSQNARLLAEGPQQPFFFANERYQQQVDPPSIPSIAQEFGVDSLHIVTHSKGGLDVREYLTEYYPAHREDLHILSLTTLAAPHNGSLLADIAIAAFQAVQRAGQLKFENLPAFVDKVRRKMPVSWGYFDLEISACAVFNAINISQLPLDTTYNTVIGDADSDSSGSINWLEEIAALRLESKRLNQLVDEPGGVTEALAGVNVLYQLLRGYSAIYTSNDYQVIEGDFRDYYFPRPVIRGVKSETAMPNDTLVTQDSGRGVGSFQIMIRPTMFGGGHEWYQNLVAVHPAAAGYDIAAGTYPGVIWWMMKAEQERGDLYE